MNPIKIHRLLAISLMLLVLWLPSQALAHAKLTTTDPAADARLAEPPELIRLEFNQKLETLASDAITVTGPDGLNVAIDAAELSEDGKSVNISADDDWKAGEYKVTYEVLSVDGHVVKGSYSFTLISDAPQNQSEEPVATPEPAEQSGVGETNTRNSQQSSREPILASDEEVEQPGILERLAGLDSEDLAKAAFYLAFLPLAGIVLWGVLLRGSTDEQKRRHRNWTKQLSKVYFLVLIAAMAEFVYRTTSFEDLERVRSALLSTTTGLAWSTLLILAVTGIVLLGKVKVLDAIWLLAAIAVKTQIGHAAAADERIIASLMTGVHLLAASVWTGGLLIIVLLCRRDRYEAERFLPTFSGAALASFVLLAISGFVNSAIYLPDLLYLLDARWGLLLIAKLILVAVVAAAAWVIQRRFQRSGLLRLRAWLRLDLVLFILIAALAGLLTSSEPIPNNEPLHWHVMGEEVHMSADITPLSTGFNNYGVTVWLPEESGVPKGVEIRFVPGKSGEESAAVTLARNIGSTDLAFDGFREFHYHASGAQIDRPGWWRLVVAITDDKGQVWEYRQLVKIY